MKVLHIGMLGVVLVMLAGCNTLGLGSKRIDYRSGAEQTPVLEVPPDLTAPSRDERYRVPQGDDESVATFSDYNKDGASATQGRRAGAVLPEVKNVRLERNGAQRWLAVSDKPENVWAVVKAFLQGSGLTIKSEDQAAGVMETEWAENRAQIPQRGTRNESGKAPDDGAGERDQYRVRLERGKDGVTTEIYISHRGMIEVLDADKNTSRWQVRPNDPEMEAAMLQRLMLRFGDSETRQGGVSGAAPGESGLGAVRLYEASDGSSIIVVGDAFDRAWRRIGLAIERAGLSIEDKDRAKGIYFLRPPKAESGWLDKMQFWKDSKNTNMRYRVNIRDGGMGCEVSVTDQNGASDNASKEIVEVIYKNISQGQSGSVSAPISSVNATGPSGTASLQEIFDGSSVIVVNDAFDKSWSKIGLAIERAGFAVENSDRAKGIYYLRPAKAESSWLDNLQFWKEGEITNTHYRVNVKDGGKACEVSVTNQDGVSGDATKQMIEAIYKNIN